MSYKCAGCDEGFDGVAALATHATACVRPEPTAGPTDEDELLALRRRVAELDRLVFGKHGADCACLNSEPACRPGDCPECDCLEGEIEELRADLHSAEAAQVRIAQESERRLQRIGELEKESDDRFATIGLAREVVGDCISHGFRGCMNSWLTDKLCRALDECDAILKATVRPATAKAAERVMAVAKERDQAAALAREWREKAEEAERYARTQKEKQAALVKETSGDRVALAGFRGSAEALAKFLSEFSMGEMDPSPAMASASAITYIRYLWERIRRAEEGKGEQPLTERTF